MDKYSIIYIGPQAITTEYLGKLERSALCARLRRVEWDHDEPLLPTDADLVLVEAGAAATPAGKALARAVRTIEHTPVIALTTQDKEHHGIAAVTAGAQDYICVDTVSDASQQDIFQRATRRHRLMTRLSETDNTVLSILKSINDGVIVVDQHGLVLDINPAARSILNLGSRQALAANWLNSFGLFTAGGNDSIAPSLLPLERARHGEKFDNQVVILRADDIADIVLSINGQGLYDSSNALVGGVITFRDITDSTRRSAMLEQQAQFDELTMLANRRLFREQLEKAIGRSKRNTRSLAVLFLDLDHFKSVNDTLGHDAGDQLLKQVADRLRGNLRVGDFIGRWGGDEFVICLEDFGDSQNAGAAAQKIVLVLSEKYFIGENEVYATPSIGVAMYPDSGSDPDGLIKAADVAMYQAKKRGGARFQYYSSAMNVRLEQREELEIGLRHALVRNEFVLHYQPRIDLNSGRLIALEALLRWQHPRFGLLAPARFLPILESSGLIHSAGEWVVKTACQQLAAWQQQFDIPDLAMTVNISAQQLSHGRLPVAVASAISNAGLDAGCLELEISDSSIIGERAAELKILQALRATGVQLSLGHFGVGEISFASLDTGVIDSFILDPSLIEDVTNNDRNQRIIRAAIAMARGLDIEVAAEGVETIAQLEFLRSCRCDLAQGFLISHPVQADRVGALLHAEIYGNGLLPIAE